MEDLNTMSLEELKNKAKFLGISVGNSGKDAIIAKIEEAEKNDENEEDTSEPTKKVVKNKTPLEIRREAMKLVRVIVTSLDPKDLKSQGTLVSVITKHTGKVAKFVPFGEEYSGEKGYHIPNIIYNKLLNDKFLQHITKKDAGGVPRTKSRWVRKYSIEVLPQLTPKELEELKQRQLATQKVDN